MKDCHCNRKGRDHKVHLNYQNVFYLKDWLMQWTKSETTYPTLLQFMAMLLIMNKTYAPSLYNWALIFLKPFLSILLVILKNMSKWNQIKIKSNSVDVVVSKHLESGPNGFFKDFRNMFFLHFYCFKIWNEHIYKCFGTYTRTP